MDDQTRDPIFRTPRNRSLRGPRRLTQPMTTSDGDHHWPDPVRDAQDAAGEEDQSVPDPGWGA